MHMTSSLGSSTVRINMQSFTISEMVSGGGSAPKPLVQGRDSSKDRREWLVARSEIVHGKGISDFLPCPESFLSVLIQNLTPARSQKAAISTQLKVDAREIAFTADPDSLEALWTSCRPFVRVMESFTLQQVAAYSVAEEVSKPQEASRERELSAGFHLDVRAPFPFCIMYSFHADWVKCSGAESRGHIDVARSTIRPSCNGFGASSHFTQWRRADVTKCAVEKSCCFLVHAFCNVSAKDPMGLR